jgi:hypothetical protein
MGKFYAWIKEFLFEILASLLHSMVPEEYCAGGKSGLHA